MIFNCFFSYFCIKYIGLEYLKYSHLNDRIAIADEIESFSFNSKARLLTAIG